MAPQRLCPVSRSLVVEGSGDRGSAEGIERGLSCCKGSGFRMLGGATWKLVSQILHRIG